MSVIALLTDFGLKDGHVGAMKGVIWGIVPGVQIADISHLIPPQNVAEGALVLFRTAPYFPAGTVFTVVVDPGVGTSRRALAGMVGDQYFVAPDNGVVSMWLGRAESQGLPCRFVQLDNPKYWLPQVSLVFHGRDIFAPVSAHLAAGVPLEMLGTPVFDPFRLQFPQPQKGQHGWLGQVIHIDHFGNITTNLRQEHLAGQRVTAVQIGDVTIPALVRTFGERPPGSLVALLGSSGDLIVAEVNGNAAHRLGVQTGDSLEVRTKPE